MTDNERLGKILEFVKTKLSEVEADIKVSDEDYYWGARAAFNEVLEFMDGLMD